MYKSQHFPVQGFSYQARRRRRRRAQRGEKPPCHVQSWNSRNNSSGQGEKLGLWVLSKRWRERESGVKGNLWNFESGWMGGWVATWMGKENMTWCQAQYGIEARHAQHKGLRNPRSAHGVRAREVAGKRRWENWCHLGLGLHWRISEPPASVSYAALAYSPQIPRCPASHSPLPLSASSTSSPAPFPRQPTLAFAPPALPSPVRRHSATILHISTIPNPPNPLPRPSQFHCSRHLSPVRWSRFHSRRHSLATATQRQETQNPNVQTPQISEKTRRLRYYDMELGLRWRFVGLCGMSVSAAPEKFITFLFVFIIQHSGWAAMSANAQLWWFVILWFLGY